MISFFYQGCTELQYLHQVTSSTLLPSALKHVFSPSNASDVDSYVRANVALVNVYLSSPTVTSHRRSELFGASDFVSNIGGLCGLFLGVSALSLVELIAFLASALSCPGPRAMVAARRQSHRVQTITVK